MMKKESNKTVARSATAVKSSGPDQDLILHDYTEEAYLKYAIASVKERALAQVQDGQKPVQKRILYAMRSLGLKPGVKPVKSARVVGDVIGKLHPHGDGAVYDAMVRMAQDFTLRHPVIAGQGNFGSRDGDPAAAYRYCFAAGTRVATEFGLVPIEQIPQLGTLFGHAKEVLTKPCEIPVRIQVATRGESRPALFWVNSGFQDTVRVTTRRGYSVRCTPNEPFLVLNNRLAFEWKDAQALKIGDLLCLQRDPRLTLEGGSPFVKGFREGVETAQFAGYFSGRVDEFGGRAFALHFDTRKSALTAQALALEVFGTDLSTEIQSIDGHFVLTLSGVSVARFANELRRGGELPQGRWFPETVFRASTSEVSNFFYGLMLSTSGTYKRAGVQYAELVLGSLEAAQDAKLLLLQRLGVISGRYYEIDENRYVMRIAGKEPLRKLFAPLAKKPSKLPTAIALAEKTQLEPHVAQAISPLSSSVCAESEVGDYFFDPVRGVACDEKTWVYDLTVPVTHAFIANGFVVHNTECRLAAFSDVLLSELDRGTVDYKPNFDNTTDEPVILPARLPVIALNGSMGIAVGMASDIPPHNLREVVSACVSLVKTPETTDDQVLEHIPGPDFPDGGQLISSAHEVQAAYLSGRGVLRVRARWVTEELARGQWQIAITELPYQVSTKRVLEQIEAICNPQPTKGKSISQQQAYLKTAALNLLEKATDESGKDAAIRLVLSPRNSKTDPEELMAFLFANTDLEASVSVNLTFIGLDGSPQTRGLPEMLRQWCTFRVQTVRRRVQFDLKQILDRIHLLEGRMIVFLNVDEAIKVIRDSDDPKASLIARFRLSDRQAEDILEMRLRQLARLEGIKIEQELKKVQAEQAKLESYLGSESAMRALVIQELEADAATYGEDRRTLIKAERRAESQASITKSVVDEPITILISRNLWIRARPGHDVDVTSINWKTGDGPLAIVKARTSQPVVMIDSKGRAYSVDAAQIPTGRGDGVPLPTMIELQEGAKLLYVLAGDPEQKYVFAGANGYGFKASLSALVARPRAGKAFLTLEDGETPLPPVKIESDQGFIAAGSSDGRLLIFPVEDVKAIDKGKGVMLLVLAEGAKMCALHFGSGEPMTLPLSGGKSDKILVKGDDWRKFCMRRARRGCQLPKKSILAA